MYPTVTHQPFVYKQRLYFKIPHFIPVKYSSEQLVYYVFIKMMVVLLKTEEKNVRHMKREEGIYFEYLIEICHVGAF